MDSDDGKKAVAQLLLGQELTQRLKTLLRRSPNPGDDVSLSAAVDMKELSAQIFDSFTNTISILFKHRNYSSSSPSSSSHDHQDYLPPPPHPDHRTQFMGTSMTTTTTATATTSVNLKDRRGSYKRRKAGTNSDTWTEYSHTSMADSHAWRKYGQKNINDSKYPRNYFRCSHNSNGCPATKQVQRIDDGDDRRQKKVARYRTTYYGHHTCTNLLQLHLPPELTTEIDILYSSSSKILSFDGSGTNAHHDDEVLRSAFFSSHFDLRQADDLLVSTLPPSHNTSVTNQSPSTSSYPIVSPDHRHRLAPVFMESSYGRIPHNNVVSPNRVGDPDARTITDSIDSCSFEDELSRIFKFAA